MTALTRQMLEDELDRARIRRVNVTEDMLTLYLEDGRVVGMPTVWSPRLSKASEAGRQNDEIIGHGAVESRGDHTVGIPTILASSRYSASMSAVTFTRRMWARSSSSSSIWRVSAVMKVGCS